MKAVGYIRVSTEEQARTGLSVEAQRAAISVEAQRRGWTVAFHEDQGWSGKDLRRPGVRAALAALAAGEASVLVVAKLDRLSRSMPDFAGTMELARRQGWALVALDLGVDTTTPAGELVANVMASVAQWERRVISQRTSDALAVKKAQGVRLGRPRAVKAEVLDRIMAAHTSGASYSGIARILNGEGTPTAHGGSTWHPSTVARIVRSVVGEAA